MKKPVIKNRSLHLLFTGLTMGIADLVPGVSGGTIAFLFGIYDELLRSIKVVTGQVPKNILTGNFTEAFRLIPFGFLVPLTAGLALAIFGFVHVISFLLATQPILVWALFFGLVLGSAYVVYKRITAWTIYRSLLLGLGCGLTFIIVGLPALSGSASPVAVFLTGAIAITAMILPGISGSLIMVLLGQYEVIINAVALRDFATMGIFFAGAIIGLAIFVRLLTWLLKHYYLAVIAFLVGVMFGSLRRLWPWQTTSTEGEAINLLPPAELAVVPVLILIVLGFVIVLLLDRAGITKPHDDSDTRMG